MRRFPSLILLAALFAPLSLFALDYSDRTSDYADAPFNAAEAAAISVLTSLGALEGNPDGTFAPDRILNRAEFLKIVLLSSNIRAGASDAADCFPDVSKIDWFSPFICLAKTRGMVQGYPDGFFRPAQSVNYAEALKMLGELYVLREEVPEGSPWYETYREAAYTAGTGLPGLESQMARTLTRGEMARLAAAYRAYDEGELALYRSAEKGILPSSSSASSSRSSQSSASSTSSASSASSVSSTSSFFPSRSRLLLFGQTTGPIADGTFSPRTADASVRLVTVKLDRKSDAINALVLVDAQGKTLATLTLDRFDQEEKTWKAILDSGALQLPFGKETTLGLMARLKPRGGGGSVEELIFVQTFSLNAEEAQAGSYEMIAGAAHFPKHQTVQGLITSAENVLGSEGALQEGAERTVASFRFRGTADTGVSLRVEHLRFKTQVSGSMVAERWHIGSETSPTRHSCSVSGEYVNCLSIPEEMGALINGEGVLTLSADITFLPEGGLRSLRADLEERGSLEEFGAVQWTDGSGHYRWTDLPEPIARGTLWTE